tara:strand:+ start:1005 stop:1490 length:486 start_codon:yes stop_codon:yes gene_type:complete
MSDLILPTHMAKTRKKQKTVKEIEKKQKEVEDIYGKRESKLLDPENIDISVAEKLPKPTGWRVLILPYMGAERSKGGIILSDQTREREQLATVCGYVVAVGPDAYADQIKFPEGPWCKKGDWVIFARYAGSRLKIDGGELRLLNDDEILAILQDPTDILHM